MLLPASPREGPAFAKFCSAVGNYSETAEPHMVLMKRRRRCVCVCVCENLQC